MNFLITGGAGFIGSHLVKRLTEQNHNVVIYDIKAIPSYSVTHRKDMEPFFFYADVVIHCAAGLGINFVKNNPQSVIDTNIIGTMNVVSFAKKYGTYVIFLSTSEVYGECFHKSESNFNFLNPFPNTPRGCYAFSKYIGEEMVRYLPEYTIIRPFNIYGPGQTEEGAIRTFSINAIKNEDIFISGNGTQRRSWCYIDDFINAMDLIIKNKLLGDFNIGNPMNNPTIFTLAKIIIEKTNSTSQVKFSDKIPDIDIRFPLIDKIQSKGFIPQVGLDEGLDKSISWYRKYLK